MSCSKLLLITGDVVSTSAQGVRYSKLFYGDSEKMAVSILSHDVIASEKGILSLVVFPKLFHNGLTLLVKRVARRFMFPDLRLLELNKYMKAACLTMSQENISKVVFGMTPFSFLLIAPKLKRKIGDTKIFGDMSDPFSFSISMRGSFVRRFLAHYIERKCLPYFDAVVVLNPKIKEKYCKRYPAIADKFQVIEQGVDEDFVREVNNLSTQGTSDSVRFLYAGGFYKVGRNPQNLYSAFEHCNIAATLDIYGNLRSSIRPKKSERIKYHKAVSKQELITISAKADALILFDNDFGYQVPGKTLETLAINKPVLFIYNNDDSPTLDYVKEASGIVWAKNTVEDISHGIKRIIAGDFAGRSFDYSRYTWDKMRDKCDELLRSQGE